MLALFFSLTVGVQAGTMPESAVLEPRAQFEYALIAFTKMCKAPPEAAGEIVQQVVRERLA